MDQFLQSCVVDKDSDSYMLTVGPLVALFGGIITTMTMFKAFAATPWPDLGMNMLIISIILLLVGFGLLPWLLRRRYSTNIRTVDMHWRRLFGRECGMITLRVLTLLPTA